MKSRSFASDNNAGIHPDLLKAIEKANQGDVVAYGDDPFTLRAIQKFQSLFKKPVEVFFVFNGTAANVLALQSATDSFNAVFCSEKAHIHVDECGAPEKFTGCKLITLPAENGKITVEQVAAHMSAIGDQHHVQPKVISIAQSTEMGTVYTAAEIKALSDYAHQHNLFLHMDGARIANAVASLDCDISDITEKVGVDILSFGGTKNGMLLGEAVIFFNRDLAENFKFRRKQAMQLASKMRFISAQFEALLTNDLWIHNAKHANHMATLLADKVSKIPDINITQNVEANAVFAIIPKNIIPQLREKYFFYTWNEALSEVRWMTSFSTQESDIEKFVECIKVLLP